MATIYKAADVFKPLTDEQKRVAKKLSKEQLEFLARFRGQFKYRGDIFNLKAV